MTVHSGRIKREENIEADGVDTADSFGKTAIKSKGPATYEQKGHVHNRSTVGFNSASIDRRVVKRMTVRRGELEN